MKKSSGVKLMDGEKWSSFWKGYIEKKDGTFRKPRPWTNKEGKIKCVNSYYVKKTCVVCLQDMLQDKTNAKNNKYSVCGKVCFSSLIRKPDGFSKPKRTGSDSHVLVKNTSHPHASKTGYVPEHRLVIEAQVGRILDPSEQVHHINLIKNDNRPENLVLFRNASEHFKAHGTLNKCVAELIDDGIIRFNRETNSYEVT